MKRLFLGIAVLAALFWAPWIYQYLRIEIVSVQDAEPKDAALVFGALVRNGVISPLHEERLLSGKQLFDDGKTEVLVLSNSERAARFMRDFLMKKGVSDLFIEIDGDAIQTSDTCAREAKRETARSISFVSQSFHLPRIALHCERIGIEGQFVAAETLNESSSKDSLWTKVKVRTRRYAREAALVWSVYIGVYEQD